MATSIQTPVRPAVDVIECDICGGEMVDSMCKLVCPNCGRRHDCSDGPY